MQEEIKPKKLKKLLKKAKIEKRDFYYREEEIELVVDLPGRDDEVRVPIRLIKATLNVLEEKKRLIQEEIDQNQKWLDDVKADLAKIKYFKFEE